MSLNDSSKIKDILAQLATLSLYPEYPPFLPDLLVGLLLTELGLSAKRRTSKGCQLAPEIAKFIQEKTGLVSAQQIAERFGYNKDYINKLFSKTYGLTIKQYCNKIKLQNAKILLLTSNYTIKQISSILGFSDDNLFIKFFKYHEKISPSKFRNSYIK